MVIYDGGQTADANNPVFDLTVKGFYQATGGTNARITYLVGDGDVSKQEALSVDGTTIAINTFQSMQGQSWDNPTFTVNVPEDHGSLETRVAPVGSSLDCLSFAAVAVSVPVKDADGDGLVDIWETSTAAAPILDPNGAPLPPLGDMGANPSVPDIFLEFGYLTADAGTIYGLPGAQVTSTAFPFAPAHEAGARSGGHRVQGCGHHAALRCRCQLSAGVATVCSVLRRRGDLDA